MSKMIIVEGNSNDKDNVRAFMVKGEKGDPGELSGEDIVDNLNSTASNKVLSAKQGKVLKSLIDQKPYYFDTVALMKVGNLSSGDCVITKGYYFSNDGGGAIYEVRSITNEDVIDEMFIIGLNDENIVAELVKTNILNIKQIGAYGDGSHDDTQYFSRFINSNINCLVVPTGEYLITNTLEFNNKSLKGFNADIYINRSNNDEFGLYFKGNYNIEDVNFYDISQTSKKIITLQNSSFSTLKNCRLECKSTNNIGGGVLDLYTNNHDIIIDNCYLYTQNDNGGGGVYVRENVSNKETYNITFSNCHIIGDTKDEVIATWGWYGSVHDILFTNCIIEKKPISQYTTENVIMITLCQNGYENSTTKNIKYDNCKFIARNTRGTIFSASKSSSVTNINKNIYITNCSIETENITTLSNSIFNNINNIENFIVDNCYIKMDNTLNIGSNNTLIKNCKIESDKQLISTNGWFDNCLFYANNEVVETISYFARQIICNNCTFYGLNMDRFFQAINNNDFINIENCKFFDSTFNTYFIQAGAWNTSHICKISNNYIPKNIYIYANDVTGYCCDNYLKAGLSIPNTIYSNNNQTNITYE